MKTIQEYILESKGNQPELINILNILKNNAEWDVTSDEVIDTLVSETLYNEDEDVNSLGLSNSDIRKIFKGYDGCHFYGARISDEKGDDVSNAFFGAHGDESEYDHILDWADEYYLDENEEIALYRYEDKTNNVLLIWSGYDLDFIFLAEK